MRRTLLSDLSGLVLLPCLILAHSEFVRAEDSAQVKAQFANPPCQYASAPLWTWNDMLTEEQIVSAMEDLAGQKVKQVFVHPRPGLMTPYLDKDWFRMWKVALREAERLDMNVWIYDENSYPSGFAGGLVPEAMPEARGKGLDVREEKLPPKPDETLVAVFRLKDPVCENITAAVRAGQTFPKGKYLVAKIRLAPQGGWFGGRYYVDLLKPGVTEKFIEITMGAYKREIGQHFGKRVPGVFTDEPHLAPAGGFHWSDHLPELFQQRWGYDLVETIPSLVRPVGDWQRVRHNYYQLLLEQFIEHWSKPFNAYCEANDLEFTGHYWEHGWPGAGHGGDNMAMYAWHQRPAIDTLFNQYSEDVHAQFGNVRAVMELGSVANQMGRKRTLCEAYGAGGWDLRLEDMKRIGDWLYVLGVNTLNEHIADITIRGARKRDHPQTFSYHEPWWDSYHVIAEYFTRLSLVISSGQQINQILVVEPTSTSWMYQGDPRLTELGDRFQALVTQLAKDQVEFDLGCEDIINRHGSTDGAKFIVGQRAYHTVLLPPITENLSGRMIELLDAYLAAGGTVLSCGPPPLRVNGAESELGAKLAAHDGFKQIDAAQATDKLLKRSDPDFSVRQNKHDKGILFHHRRQLDDGDFLLLVNTSIDADAAGEIHAAARNAIRWNLQSGHTTPYHFAKQGDGLSTTFSLPPCGSLLLFLSDTPGKTRRKIVPKSRPIEPTGPMQIRRQGRNVLTIDYVDVTAGGQTKENVYSYPANTFTWQQNGEEGCPWDRAVQFRDELITKKFPADSGFQATYRFTLQTEVPDPLSIVIERPDLYTVTCNGKPVAAKEGRWWLDKSFAEIDITAAAKLGQNAVAIKASPMSVWHELEPAYVLGNFRVKPANSGFVIVPDRPLEIAQAPAHGNDIEGTMWLSAGVGYHRDPNGEGNDRDPFVVFDLGKPQDLAAIEIWNYNEINISARGVKKLAVTGSADAAADSFTIPIGTFELAQAAGETTVSQILPVDASGVRFVKFDILSNHRGVTFPVQGNKNSAFVGLSEVRFHAPAKNDAPSKAIQGVTIQQVSSELLDNHDRRAVYMLDGSGMTSSGLGWNRQGHPFYGHGVSYTQKFNFAQTSNRISVKLPDWLGSVAKVFVNGKMAGHIAYQPWTCDVTQYIVPGENTVRVLVIGTLKNTLGPHHCGNLLGLAGPGHFQRGPQNQPPGNAYQSIAYGLFKPFTLMEADKQ